MIYLIVPVGYSLLLLLTNCHILWINNDAATEGRNLFLKWSFFFFFFKCDLGNEPLNNIISHFKFNVFVPIEILFEVIEIKDIPIS